MYILNVFWPMLNDVTWRNASERQVNGIRAWQDYVRRAVLSAPPGAAPAGSMDVPFNGAASHRTWRAACWGILSALSRQAGEAQALKALADAEAADQDRAADRAAAAAASARDEAAAAEHAAAARWRREKAAEARAASAAFSEWDIAASDAGTFGRRVLANEEPAARRVGEGIAAAGGLPEVPRDKRYAA